MKSIWVLLLAAAMTSSTMATGHTAPLSMSPSPPASATANAAAERDKASFADASEQDFNSAPSLDLGIPTAAESKSLAPPKQGAPVAIGFRRATISGNKVFSARPGITLQGSESGVARLSVSSGTAKALRVALDLSTLPADASIAVRGSDEFTRIVVAGRVADLRKLNTTDGYWTPATQGERQYIEIMLPQAAGKTTVTVRINALSHITIALSQLNVHALTVQKVGQSGSCESNVVCQTGSDFALANTATSVARMIFTDAGSSFLCSGTLLNDTNTSFTPNFYSAHHCISSQVVASSLNTFWFYDSPTCPNGTTVGAFIQQTGGAIYLFSDATIDGLLLRLNDATPAGAVLAGWDANSLADGVSVTGIHHPAGDVKKVSRGLSKAAGCAATRSCVGWTQGTTEGGSSGSGLFTYAAPFYRLRGGLYGGSATCANTGNVNDSNNTDQYSRLSSMYPSISQYLAPPAAASNNNFVNASNLSGLPASASGTNVNATKEPGEPNHPTTGNVGGASVWWNWTAPSSGVVKVSTAGSGFDTSLGVYTGNAVNALTRVTYTEDYSDDTPTAVTSSVSFQASAGVTYRIAVDGYKSSTLPVATGSIALAITSVGSIVTTLRASDLSGDGRSDIIWNYGGGGSGAAVWLMNGVAATSYAGLNVPANWRVVATGDFNGDGKADLLWYNNFTGQTAIWLMNGATQIGSAVIFTDASGGWLPVAAGDTNGDGRADIIWWNQHTGQSAIWLMNGFTQIAGAVIYTDSTNVPNASGWRPVATGDFNGDGKADILWYNQRFAQTGIWLMDGMTMLASSVIYSDVQYPGSPYWTPVAAGDNDGDGKADILWYNQFTGQSAIWHMNGLNQIDGAVVYTDTSPGGWQAVGFGDYNGDGRSDILWYRPFGRQAAIWLMNGFTTIQGAVIYAGGDLWRPL